MKHQNNTTGKKCGCKCEVWSRVCGYFRPVNDWNRGKKEEFLQRKTFILAITGN